MPRANHFIIKLEDGKFLASDEISDLSTDDLFQSRRFDYKHQAHDESEKHSNSEVYQIKLQTQRVWS